MSLGSEIPHALTPTRKRTLRIWWVYTWRTLLYLAILSVAMNVPLGFITGAVEVMFPPLARIFPTLAGFVVAAAVGLFVIYSNVLDEEIGDFCVTLEQKEVATDSHATVTAPGN